MDQLANTQKSKGRVPAIVLDSINRGGMADSIYQGIKYSVASLVGFDIHSKPGALLVNQRLTQEVGAPTDDLYKILACTDGNVYLFGKTNGKVYQRVSSVSYTLLGTVSPSSGTAGILDAGEYNGSIYYAMQNYLGKWTIGTNFSTRQDNFGLFSKGNSGFHPMIFIPREQKLYGGDSQYIWQVDLNGIFTGNALQLASNLTVSCVGMMGSSLVIGTTNKDGVSKSQILTWDTWSVQPNTSDYIDEVGMNAIIPAHDIVLVQAGLNGNLYSFDGNIMTLIKQIPGSYDNANQGIVNYSAVGNKMGIPIFGFSRTLGNPTLQGIYSFGMRNYSLPRVMAIEFPISNGNMNNLNIWSICLQNNDIYVSWEDGSTGIQVFGIDKIDWSNKITNPYLDTLVSKYSRQYLDRYKEFIVNYESLPNGTSIDLQVNVNGKGFIDLASYVPDPILIDTDRNMVYAVTDIIAKTFQLRISPQCFDNNAPVIQDALILME